MPLLVAKFKTNLARRFPEKQARAILNMFSDAKQLDLMPVHEFVDRMVI
jgi:2-methylcitrate dehydratase